MMPASGGKRMKQGGGFAALWLAVAPLAAAPTSACVFPPPPLQLPDETIEQWKARAAEEIERGRVASLKEAEVRDFDAAKRVYLARVVKSEEVSTSDLPYGRRTALKPLAAIKGVLPVGNVTLKTTVMTSCGPESDGSGVWAPVAALAIVFEGVEPYGFRNLTVSSLLIEEVQDTRIAGPARKFLEQNPQYGQWPTSVP